MFTLLSRPVASIGADVKVTTFEDRVMVKVWKWRRIRLQTTGAYARGAMKKQIKPRLAGTKKSRTVMVTPVPADFPPHWHHVNYNPIPCLVQTNGLVINLNTSKPVPRKIAQRARMMVASLRKGQGEGQPPRRGQSDKLRTGIIFIVDPAEGSVVIGPRPFAKQPPMIDRKTVPQLLNRGGIEIIFGEKVDYGPRPYVETILGIGLKKLRDEIAAHPIK